MSEDELYADWCLTNNWMKLDREAGIYVCGESLFDDDYLAWVESTL